MLQLLTLIALMFAVLSICHHLLTVILFLCRPLCQWEFQGHMAVPWITWTRFATHTLGAQQKQPISKTILDFHLDNLVLVISGAQMSIIITCFVMEGFTTTMNGRDQLLSHFMWKM